MGMFKDAQEKQRLLKKERDQRLAEPKKESLINENEPVVGQLPILPKGDIRSLEDSDKTRSEILNELMDDYAVRVIRELYLIGKDPTHPLYKTRGFEALKVLALKLIPNRKEISGQAGGPVEFSLAEMFKGNSLPERAYKVNDRGEIIDGEVVNSDKDEDK